MPKDNALDRVPVALTPMERFEEYLRSRGMRNTEQRRILVEYVFSQHDHFDADALIEKLPRKGQPQYVSRPTVYRTLGGIRGRRIAPEIRTRRPRRLRT